MALEPNITAVLGPTNTGKTHLAVERLCAHSSGVMGFPLRLLAREVYDRVVAIKGANQVALVTGEEKIVPRDARWYLCTAESMPDHDTAFVALDEAQLGADRERGHVFTDRLLNRRGREETMILGAESLRPMIRALVPEAEIVARPRFSTLSYAGAKKISRLPKRSAIVAFSAEEVYAVAEMLRRLRGGAAVVMGALSPRTRNAQVAMFQAGEVDYLVATDAIGMGLNMDVAHVAFASLSKFDGQRSRRLTVAEMAQIAGRAGRHQRDGTFGALVDEGPGAFAPEEVLAIEEHRFPKLDHLFWREGDPDLSSIDTLIADLERKPANDALRAAPQSMDLAVLKRLAEEPEVRDRVRSRAMVARLWAACGLPDFRKSGIDPHARFVSRVFGYLSQGHIPHQWFADEIARLDTVAGDVETLAGRIASVRSWAYIANRKDWLADPDHWAARTREVEERLSDALHASLTQRFVDKRTTALIRKIGADASQLPVVIGADGEVRVDDHPIGRLDGFRFTVDAAARAGDRKLLLAAAERHLVGERGARADALIAAAPGDLTLDGAAIVWRGDRVAALQPGPSLARPRIVLDPSLRCLAKPVADRVGQRVERWFSEGLTRHARALVSLAAMARDADAGPALRVVAGTLEDAAGVAARLPMRSAVEALGADERKRLRGIGITVGALDLFDPKLLKPGAQPWRGALLAARGRTLPPSPDAATVLARGAAGATLAAGYRPLARQAVRIDLVERIARGIHDARPRESGKARAPFSPDTALATSIGLEAATIDRLMIELGFRELGRKPESGDGKSWAWRGRPAPRQRSTEPPATGAFAGLAELVRHG